MWTPGPSVRWSAPGRPTPPAVDIGRGHGDLRRRCPRRPLGSPRRLAMELRGRVAVVTGGGAGLGRDVAHALAAEGARVLVVELTRAAARRSRARSPAAGEPPRLCRPTSVTTR